MTEIAFSCPSCVRGYQVDVSLAGRRTRCKQCGEVFRVPEGSSDEPASFEFVPPPAASSDFEYSLVEPEPSPGADSDGPRNPGRAIAAGAGDAALPKSKPDREGVSAMLKSWPVYRLKIAALAAVLLLLGWAFAGLSPAWEAGHVLIGGAAENPNDPLARAAETRSWTWPIFLPAACP